MGYSFHPGETDLLSNATRIVAQPDEDPRPWLGAVPTVGSRQLLTFVHEATHNWCFSSAVGQAQVFIAQRAETNATLLGALWDDPDPSRDNVSLVNAFAHFGSMFRAGSMYGDKRGHFGGDLDRVRGELAALIADDLLRLEVAEAILRPLAEGLALFAEYDAVSRGASTAWSPLPSTVAWNFAGREILRAGSPVAMTLLAATRLLQDARLSRVGVDAKASVLVQPLDCSAGGYLPGYLAVKSMWRHLYGHNMRLYGESDLVLAYLRSFFYGNLELAAAIAAPPGLDLEGANRIVEAFTRRLVEFDQTTDDDVAEFERFIAQPVATRDWFTPGLLRSQEQGEAARDLLDAAYENYDRSLPMILYPDLGWHDSVGPPEQRGNLIVSSVPVTIAPDPDSGGITVSWRELPVLAVGPQDLVPVTKSVRNTPITAPAAAQLDVLLVSFATRNGLSRAAVIRKGREIVACTGWGPDPGEARNLAIEEFRSRDDKVSAANLFRWSADQALSTRPWLSQVREQTRSALPGITDELYRDTALWRARDNTAIDNCAALMHEQGMYALLGSAGAVKRMALLGLVASINSSEDFINSVFRAHGYELAAAVEETSQCWERHGFPRPVVSHEAKGIVVAAGEVDGNILIPLI